MESILLLRPRSRGALTWTLLSCSVISRTCDNKREKNRKDFVMKSQDLVCATDLHCGAHVSSSSHSPTCRGATGAAAGGGGANNGGRGLNGGWRLGWWGVAREGIGGQTIREGHSVTQCALTATFPSTLDVPNRLKLLKFYYNVHLVYAILHPQCIKITSYGHGTWNN